MPRFGGLQTVGLLLVAGGLLLILERLGVLAGGGPQLIIGAILIVLYVRVRLATLIVLGLILLAIGVGRGIQPPPVLGATAWHLLWLGAAFVLVFLVRTCRYRDRYRWWPLYPAGAIWALAGVVVLEREGLMPEQAADALAFLWPVALIAVGVWLLVPGFRRRRQRTD